MIVLDASVLVAYLENADRHHDRAEELLAREIDENLGVNVVTLGEVLVGPARHDRLEQVRSILVDLELAELLFPTGASTQLANLRSSTYLKLPDCCVLLAAQQHGAGVASFDVRLMAAADALGLALVEG